MRVSQVICTTGRELLCMIVIARLTSLKTMAWSWTAGRRRRIWAARICTGSIPLTTLQAKFELILPSRATRVKDSSSIRKPPTKAYISTKIFPRSKEALSLAWSMTTSTRLTSGKSISEQRHTCEKQGRTNSKEKITKNLSKLAKEHFFINFKTITN